VTRFWVTKAAGKQIPRRWAGNSKSPTTETVQSVARYDQLALSGRPKMLLACNCYHDDDGGGGGGSDDDDDDDDVADA